MSVGLDSGTNKQILSTFPLSKPIKINDPTHVQLVVRDKTAQLFLDNRYVGTAALTANFLLDGGVALGLIVDTETARTVTFANVDIRSLDG